MSTTDSVNRTRGRWCDAARVELRRDVIGTTIGSFKNSMAPLEVFNSPAKLASVIRQSPPTLSVVKAMTESLTVAR